MTNFIFKSPRRLIKNSPVKLETIMNQLLVVQEQNRHLRQDLVDVKLMLNKLLITEHLQKQVDDFYERDSVVHPDDEKDLD